MAAAGSTLRGISWQLLRWEVRSEEAQWKGLDFSISVIDFCSAHEKAPALSKVSAGSDQPCYLRSLSGPGHDCGQVPEYSEGAREGPAPDTGHARQREG